MNISLNEKHLPPDSAGRLMTEKAFLVNSSQTLGNVKERLLKEGGNFESLNYVYVVDETKKLIGVLALKEIFRKPADILVSQIMKTDLVTVHPFTDQEHVAIKALKHNLKAIPVVDKEGKFLGIVPPDAILRILHQEHVEDFLLSAGIKSGVEMTDILKGSAALLFRLRFPWLFIGLVGGILTVFLINFFEKIISENIALAFFIPIIVYITDAVGTQTQTLLIRTLATEKINATKYILKEMGITTILALSLGGLMFLFSYNWMVKWKLALIVSISMSASIILASISALLITFSLYWFKKDPAVGSGPFATIISDIFSLAIYFTISMILL